jgi:dienelactone hydrolase
MKTLLVSALSLIAFFSAAQYSIGHTTITFNDPTRTGGFGSGGGSGRQIQTEIYYPATSTGDNTPIASGQFPVIVFGHGFAMTWDAYTNIWQRYTAQGYILAFPRTEGSLFPSPSHSEFGLDLKLVEQKMQALNANSGSTFYQKINSNSAIMGHSMGGGASFLAANGNTNIKTVIGLAPAETTPSAITAATGVTVPALIFSGSSDGVTPPADHHEPIYNALGSSCKSFVSITGGAHCYFANTNLNCDFGESTSSPNISITRSEQQAITYSLLDLWLDYKLRGNCAAIDQFLNLTTSGTGYTAQSTCSPNQVPVISYNGSVLTSSVTGIGYQWYLDGNLINGANAVQYTPLTNGDYTVVVTHEDDCTTESAPYTLTALSLNEVPEIIPVLAPNPTPGVIKISNMNGMQMDISIRDLSGKEVGYTLEGDVLDLTNQPAGIYLVQISKYHFKVTKL